MSGAAWTRVLNAANASWGAPNLCDQDNKVNGNVLAGALVYARDPANNAAMRTKVRNAIFAAIPTQVTGCGNATLALGRLLGAYVMAADYIRLGQLSASDDQAFRNWLGPLRTKIVGGHGRYVSLVFTATDSPHNWGTFALASLTAADVYLGDLTAVQRDWNVYQGYISRTKYAGFQQEPQSNSWTCRDIAFSPANGGCSTDAGRYGGWPKDLIRGGACCTPSGDGASYSREIMQGVVVSAELLWKTGRTSSYEVIKPAFEFARKWNIYNNHSTGYYISWMVNKRLGYNVTQNGAVWGRLFGYTDWLFG